LHITNTYEGLFPKNGKFNFEKEDRPNVNQSKISNRSTRNKQSELISKIENRRAKITL